MFLEVLGIGWGGTALIGVVGYFIMKRQVKRYRTSYEQAIQEQTKTLDAVAAMKGDVSRVNLARARAEQEIADMREELQGCTDPAVVRSRLSRAMDALRGPSDG